jgi:hypothetical protein
VGEATEAVWASVKEAETVPVMMVEDVGHTPRVLMQGRKKSRRQTPSRIPLYSY